MQIVPELVEAAAKLPMLMSLDCRGRFGYSCGFGAMRWGWVCFGFFSAYAGIYQLKHTLKGRRVSRQKFYAGSNPQTTAQQAWRAVFSAGWDAWHALTSDEKLAISKEARHLRLSGPMLWQKRWLQGHRL